MTPVSAIDLLPAHVQAQLNESSIRDDLRAIKEAEAAGWTARFRNGNWENAAVFTKDNVSVWYIRDGWRKARVVNDMYIGHETFPHGLAGLRVALGLDT